MTTIKLGLKLKDSGNYTAAEKIFRDLLNNNPEYRDARLHLGNTLVASGHLEAGINELKKNLADYPQHTLAAYNLGYALFLAQHFQEALTAFTLALNLKPDLLDARINRGSTFHALGLFDYALEDFNQALVQSPERADTHWNRALTLLSMGHYNEGWQEYEWRWRREAHKRTYPYKFEQPQWNGTAFPKQRLLVYSEQGFGDTLQFARFLPQVKALGGTVIFEVRKELTTLFENFDGIDELVIFSHQKPQTTNFDLCIPLMSLPRCLNITLDELPQPTILTVNSTKQHFWRNQINKNKINSGLVWAGQATHANDQHRSLPLEKLTCLSKLKDIHLYSLQIGDAAQQVKIFPQQELLTDCAPYLHDFGDTAALISALDLVICVDTAVAHLAASLGKPTFILLSYVPDWRWQRGRQHSPWYPSVTLLHQTTPGNWNELCERLLCTLQKL